MDQTSHIASGIREQNMRDNIEPEYLSCPRCQGMRLWGDTCPYCNYRHTTRTRMVIERDGKLKAVTGKVYKPRRTKMEADTEAIWLKTMHRGKRANFTFNQAEALFFRENGYYPPRTLPGMPVNPVDWYLKVKHVPASRVLVTPVPEAEHHEHQSLLGGDELPW